MSYIVANGNCARLERGRNIGRRSPNEGKNYEATKPTELCKTRQLTMVVKITAGAVPSLL